MTPRSASTTLLLLAGLLAPVLASARSTDRNQPMQLDADGQDCNVADANSKCVFTGNVVIVQGTLEVRASRAEVVRRNGDIDQVVLTGSQATMKQQMDDGTWMDAQADRVEYDMKTETITFIGNYTVKSDRGSNSGQRMVYNTKSGNMQSGGDGTRVRTVIQPKSAQPAQGKN